MTLDGLLNICQRYADMGDAVTNQLRNIRAGEDIAGQNINAVMMIIKFLEKVRIYCEDADDERLRKSVVRLARTLYDAVELR